MEKPKIILVVDDDEDNRNFLSGLLAEKGFDVRISANTIAALDVLENMQRTKAACFAVLTDYNMPPGRNGVELLAQVKNHNPAIVRILMSGDMPKSEQITPAEPHACLRKPFRIAHLLDALKKTPQ